ncbi:MAG: MFS transporter [Vulcanibacillus sp.]
MNLIAQENKINLPKRHFFILICTISISGFSQGLLLPLLSLLLEKQGISSASNGLSSSALYIGMLLASPFMEAPVRRFGYKPIIIFGLSIVTIAIMLFPVWNNFYFWIFLRFIVGVGDNAIHYASQLWITTTAEPRKRGRVISLYGLSYGIGFAIGPLGLILASIDYRLPFILTTVIFIIIIIVVLQLVNLKPEKIQATISSTESNNKYIKVYALAGIALVPMFIYGFLEATLNVGFPIFGLRTGLDEKVISLMLSSFAIGSLLFQLPLGYISDYIGRKKVLIIVTFVGGIIFSLMPFIHSTTLLLFLFVLAGGFTGSLFSLGLAYVTDILPRSLLPTASIIATIHFGLGSIFGPYLSGLTIEVFSPESIFYLISLVVISFSILAIIGNLFALIKKKLAAN